MEDFISKFFLSQCGGVRGTTTVTSGWARMFFGRPALQTWPPIAVGRWWEASEQLTEELAFAMG